MLRKSLAAFIILAHVLSITFPSQAIAESVTDFVVLAVNSVDLKRQSTVQNGLVGVNDLDNVIFGSRLDMTVGSDVKVESSSRLIAPNMKIKRRAVVDGNIEYNETLDVNKKAQINGDVIQRTENWPLATILTLTPCDPNPQNSLTLKREQEQTLTPGAYGDIKLRSSSQLKLEAGTYHFQSFNASRQTRVLAKGPVTICVQDRFMTNAEVYFGPDPSTALTADAILIEVHGTNANPNNRLSALKAAEVGARSQFYGKILAPQGTISIKSRAQVVGRFIGKDVIIGNNVQLSGIQTVSNPDIVAPVISNVVPENESVIQDKTPSFAASFMDNDSGVDVDSIEIIIDGNEVTPQATISASEFSYQASTELNEGTHTLEIKVSDFAGNLAQSQSVFSIEASVLPVISNILPVEGSASNERRPVVSAVLTEGSAAVDVSSIVVTLNNVDVTVQSVLTASSIMFTPSADLPDQPHTVTFEVGDALGNTSNASTTFTVDSSPPVISNITPPNETTVSNPRPLVMANMSDALSVIDNASIVVILNGNDITAEKTITLNTIEYTPAADLAEQTHTVFFQVADILGNVATATTSFLIQLPASGEPTLDPIGDQSVDVGSSLQFTLTASDPDNDPLVFSASPLPLPVGMLLNATTGVFTFTPMATQEGEIDLTFSVTDGVFSEFEDIKLTVNGPPVNAVTELRGRILDTNEFVDNGIERPVPNVTVSLLNTGFTTITDTNGFFTLSGIPSGQQVLDLDVSTATPVDPTVSYAGFREGIQIVESVVNNVARPFYLPQINADSLITVDPDNMTIVENLDLGIRLEVPPHTAKNSDGTDFTGQLSISLVPDALAPASLPPNMDPGLLITIQPVGVVFANPVPITFPNYDNLPAGTEMDIWSLEPSLGTFAIVGKGEVSLDGLEIVTVSGGVRAADWHTAFPPLPMAGGQPNDGNFDPDKPCKKDYGSQTELCSGSVLENHSTAAYRSLGVSRSSTLMYRTSHADPQPIVSADVGFGANGLPVKSVVANLEVAGIDQGLNVYTDTTGFMGGPLLPIKQALQFDADNFATGRYPYQMTLTNNFETTSLSSFVSGNVLIRNEINSSYGAGWTLQELQKLSFDPVTNDVFLEEGNGGMKYFRSSQAGSSLHFDGNDHVWFDSFGQTYEHTVEFWMNPQSPMSGIPIATIGGFCGSGLIFSASEDEICYTLNPGPIPVGGCQSPAANRKCVQVDLSNKWSHIAGTFNGSTMSLYVDGNLEIFGDIGGYSLEPTFALGGYRFNTFGWQNSYNGFMDELRVWDYARTPAEIQANMNSTLTGAETGLSAYWNMNEGAGLVINDSSPNNIDGVLAGESFLPDNAPQWAISGAGVNSTCATGSCVFQSPDGDYSELVLNSNGTFTRTLRDGSRYEFAANGLQTAMTDRNGNTTLYRYNASQNVTEIEDPVGLITRFNYVSGLLATIVDPTGRVTTFNHDSDGNLISIVDPDSTMRQFQYDSRHRMISQTSKRNFITTYDFDAAGRTVRANWPDGSTRTVTSAESFLVPYKILSLGGAINPAPVITPGSVQSTWLDGEGNQTTHTFDSFGSGLIITDPLLNVTTIERNIHGDSTAVTYAKGNGMVMSYAATSNPRERRNVTNIRYKENMAAADSPSDLVTSLIYEPQFNQVKSVTDPRGNTITSVFDYELPNTDPRYGTGGNIVEITFPVDQNGVNPVARFDYNTRGQMIEMIDPNAIVSQFEYDPSSGNLVRMIQDPSGINAITQFGYDAAGNPDTITDANNHATQLTYDPLNRIQQVTNPLNYVTNFVYEPSGDTQRVERQANVAGTLFQTTQFTYTPVDELLTINDPLNRITTFAYDGNQQTTSVTDAEANTTTYTYDPRQQLQTITDANTPQGVTTYAYDPNRNLASITDANSNVTNYTYDGFDRLLSTIYPDTSVYSYAYDANSNVTGLSTPLTAPSVSLNFVYDNLNRLIAKQYPNTPALDASYDYDLGSRLVAADVDAVDDAKNSFVYDNLNRVTINIQSLNGSVFPFSYNYDPVGNLQKTVYPSGKTMDYVYDVHDRLTDISVDGVGQAHYDYDPLDRREQKDYVNVPSPQRTSYTFDIANQLTQLTHQVIASATPLAQLDYSYDQVGNRVSRDIIKNSVTQNQTIRYNGIYELEEITGSNPELFDYDNVGNRILANGIAYAPNNLNQYTSVDGVPFSYDANGNLASDGVKSYTYDEEDRLQVFTNGVTTANYDYDAFNRRVEKDVDGVVTRFVYDGDEAVVETDSAGTVQSEYVYGSRLDEVLMMDRAGSRYYYHHDALGTVVAVTDGNGSVVEHYDYTAYGEATVLNSVNATITSSAIGNPYLFTGRRLDVESGLYYYRNRQYDPNVGRFLQRDPIGYYDSMNLFGYVDNNSFNFIDPFGFNARTVRGVPTYRRQRRTNPNLRRGRNGNGGSLGGRRSDPLYRGPGGSRNHRFDQIFSTGRDPWYDPNNPGYSPVGDILGGIPGSFPEKPKEPYDPYDYELPDPFGPIGIPEPYFCSDPIFPGFPDPDLPSPLPDPMDPWLPDPFEFRA